jgi:outer membrane protein insertion porin family
LRVAGVFHRFLPILLVGMCAAASAQESVSQSPPPTNQPRQENGELGAIRPYLGMKVRSCLFPGLPEADQEMLRSVIAIKSGEVISRDAIHDSMQALLGTGRFADVQLEATRNDDGSVDLAFVTSRSYFVGDIRVEGNADRPTANQIVNATKLQLGELYEREKADRALSNIQRLMQENGYYRATATIAEKPRPSNLLMNLQFDVVPGAQATIGQVKGMGDPGYSKGQIEDIAKMHPGDRVSVDRVSRGLQRVRSKYEKQNRLLAQVAIAERLYHPENNTVDFTFRIVPGPKVEINVEGYKIKRGNIRKYVPVYEEGALDDDLLNEGRRNLLDYMQTRGFFEASVGIRKHSDSSGGEYQVTYVIDPGQRHKLAAIDIEITSPTGNALFTPQDLRSRMRVQAAARFLSHGKFSTLLLNADIRNLQDLYRSNGFRDVKIEPTVNDRYQGKANELAVSIKIDEGIQTRVGELKIVGASKVQTAEFEGYLATSAGQGYSEINLSQDRDTVLNLYYNKGFPNATFDIATEPVANDPHRIDVIYTIKEGEQFFVNRVIVTGLDHTKPYIVRRELQVKREMPLSQAGMLDSQRRLYDLGIFSEVNTAVENPNGTESKKNVLFDLHETKRYTFDYGLGFEFQTGQPNPGSSQPLGQTGASPRVSFGVTRLNLGGRNQTVTFKTNLSRLQQRVLFNFEAPQWFNKNFQLSFTGFYDNTLDVTTFTSQRLEGSAQAKQILTRDLGGRAVSTIIYNYTFRRVRASDIAVSPGQIPLLSQPVRVGAPGFTFIRDKRDNPIETTRGNYTTFDAAVASRFFGSEADFSHVLLQNSTYQAFGKNRAEGKRYVFARSTRIGIENPFRDTIIVEPGQQVPTCPADPPPGFICHTVIPLPERFFSGGGNSHRGFGLNQAGPRDPVTGFPLGGSALFINNLELRFPTVTVPFIQDNVAFVAFHDMGNVFSRPQDMTRSLFRWHQANPEVCKNSQTASQCNYNYISHAIGMGVRYKTPIGPLRVDFGYNLNPPYFPSLKNLVVNQVNGTITGQFSPQQAGHFNFFFSIGQAF